MYIHLKKTHSRGGHQARYESPTDEHALPRLRRRLEPVPQDVPRSTLGLCGISYNVIQHVIKLTQIGPTRPNTASIQFPPQALYITILVRHKLECGEGGGTGAAVITQRLIVKSVGDVLLRDLDVDEPLGAGLPDNRRTRATKGPVCRLIRRELDFEGWGIWPRGDTNAKSVPETTQCPLPPGHKSIASIPRLRPILHVGGNATSQGSTPPPRGGPWAGGHGGAGDDVVRREVPHDALPDGVRRRRPQLPGDLRQEILRMIP